MQTEYFRLLDGNNADFEEISQLMKKYVDDLSVRSALIESYYDLIKHGALIVLLRELIAKINSHADFSPVWMSHTECPIIAHSSSVLSLRCFAPENEIDSIYASPGKIILSLLSFDDIEIELYHGAHPMGTQTLLKRVRLAQNESVEIDLGQSFRIFSNGKPALLSRLLLDLGEYMAVYDAKTLEYISMLSLNPTSSRWYFMAKVAGKFPAEDALPILKQLINHPNYNVRWTALQELFKYDVDEGVRTLRQFKTDKSEFIREQAGEELIRIEKILSEA
jgi:hypothetical protein